MPPRKPYKGVLAEAMPNFEDPDYEGVMDLAPRVEALWEHYGGAGATFATHSPLSILLELARDHVPGFRSRPLKIRFRPKTGPKPNVAKDLIILMEMLKRIEAGHSVSRAAELIAKKKPHIGAAGTIRKRWYNLQKPGSARERAVAMIKLLSE